MRKNFKAFYSSSPYCVTNHSELNGVKQQPFYYAHWFCGSGFGRCSVGMAFLCSIKCGASAEYVWTAVGSDHLKPFSHMSGLTWDNCVACFHMTSPWAWASHSMRTAFRVFREECCRRSRWKVWPLFLSLDSPPLVESLTTHPDSRGGNPDLISMGEVENYLGLMFLKCQRWYPNSTWQK